MTLIKNTIVPFDSLEIVDIVANNLIGGYDDVVRWEFWEQTATVAGVASVHDGAQVLSVLENFIIPVTSQSWWADDQ